MLQDCIIQKWNVSRYHVGKKCPKHIHGVVSAYRFKTDVEHWYSLHILRRLKNLHSAGL